MPIYEYACKHCDHTLTSLQKMNDDPLVDCPECGKPELKRLISAPRFRLKGGGWYETDFKKDNQRNLSKRDSEPEKAASASNGKSGDGGKSSSDGKADGKSERKSESKPENKTGKRSSSGTEAS